MAAQIGTEARKIVLKKWYKEFRDHITLDDCELNVAYVHTIFFFDWHIHSLDELHDGMNIELYYR